MKKSMLLTAALLCLGFLGTQSLQAVKLTFKAKNPQGRSKLMVTLLDKNNNEIKTDVAQDWGDRTSSFVVQVDKPDWGEPCTWVEVRICTVLDFVGVTPKFYKKIRLPKRNKTYTITDKGKWKFEFE